MTFAEQIHAERTRLDLTQAEAAKLLAIGKRTLEMWESGERTPLLVTQEGVLTRYRAAKCERRGG